jgi:hypothetical protein
MMNNILCQVLNWFIETNLKESNFYVGHGSFVRSSVVVSRNCGVVMNAIRLGFAFIYKIGVASEKRL